MICLLGFITNIIAVPVLVRQAKMQKISSFKYLCTLTAVDIIYLGVGLASSIPRLVRLFDENSYGYLPASLKLGLAYIRHTSVYTSRFIIIAMSSERLIAVASPVNVKNSPLAQFPTQIISGCAIFNGLFCLPYPICGSVIDGKDVNSSITVDRHTLAYSCGVFMEDYILAEAIIHNLIPTLFLLLINIAIPIQFYKASSELRTILNQPGSGTASQQWKITANVALISVIYMLLSIPFIVCKIHNISAVPDYFIYMTHQYRLDLLCHMGLTFSYVNAANDFLVFYIVSSKYRAAFKTVFCRY